MKHALLILLAVLASSANSQSQVITKLHNGVSSFFYDVNELPNIIINALPGDTIILPGGPIACGGLTINKPLTFVGAGILGLGAPVTGKTVLTYIFNQDVVLQAAGNGSNFHGIDFERSVRFTGGVSDIGFTRCVFSTFPMAGFNMSAPSNVHIKHCIFREGISNGGNSAPQGLVIENSIIEGGVNFGQTHIATAVIANCVILNMAALDGYNQGVHFSENIFTRTASSYELNSASSYSCNLFCMTSGNGLNWTGATNLGGNLGWQLTTNNVFVNVPVANTYNELYDYHLTPGSPGLPGSMSCIQWQAGLYGGAMPWKEGAIPFNPHWVSLSPALGGTNGGTINVSLSGAAQQD